MRFQHHASEKRIATIPTDPVLDGFLAGSPEPIGEVRGWIARIVGGRAWRLPDREGAVQEVLTRLLEACRSGRFRKEASFRTFVCAITRNTCIDIHRRQMLRDRTEIPDAEPDRMAGAIPDPERASLEQERSQHLRYVVQRLSADCRRLWRWVYLEKRPAREVGKLLSISEGSVRGRVHRCLNQARRLMTRLDAGPA